MKTLKKLLGDFCWNQQPGSLIDRDKAGKVPMLCLWGALILAWVLGYLVGHLHW